MARTVSPNSASTSPSTLRNRIAARSLRRRLVKRPPAARRDHIERRIRPALERGAFVVCDRFADSTRAYQGAGGEADPALIEVVERHVVGDVRPDLTLILDLPVEEGLNRAAGRGGGEARFEAKGIAFHQRLRQGFLDIAAAEPKRCVVIDSHQPREAVTEAIWTAVRERLGL